MGRLDDIIERNRDPKAASRKAKLNAAQKAAAQNDPSESAPVPSPPEDRLANIVARNLKPKGGERLLGGVVIALFVLLIIGLMVFTDLGLPKGAPRTSQPPPSDKLDGEQRVNGVQLR